MKSGTPYYQAAAAANVVVTAKPAVLERIIIGADVGSAVIEVSDSKTDGDGNIKLKLSGNTLMTSLGGEIEVEMAFENGITADIANQTDVTFIFRNAGLG